MIKMKLSSGLGNQMFQYAFCRILQMHYQQDALCDYSGGTSFGGERGLLQVPAVPLSGFKLSPNVKFVCDKTMIENDCRLRWKFLDMFSLCVRVLPKILDNKEFQLKTEKLFQPFLNKVGIYFSQLGYVPFAYTSHKKNILAEGNFLSWRYFEAYEEMIKSEFTIDLPFDDKNKEIVDFAQSHDSVCIHVRKGDFCDPRYKMINVCNKNYFESAIQRMQELVPHATFLVFSNDFEWVKTNIDFNGVEYRFIDVNPPDQPVLELRLMSSCKHFIISNSSFSWWGQFLSKNEDKIVIAPEHFVLGKHNRAMGWGLKMPDWIYIDNIKE